MGAAWSECCAAVLPALNEEWALGKLVPRVREFLPNTVVVNDASSDRTAQVAQTAGATVLSHPEHRGKGAALKTGWEWCAQQGCEWVLFLDGDGQHAPEDIPRFFEAADRTAATLVAGQRDFSCPHMPRLRAWTNAWMSRRLSRLSGSHLPDSQCGFRLVHVPSLISAGPSSRRFQIESEVLLSFVLRGERVEWVPIQTIYFKSRSHISPLSDGGRWLRWYWNVCRQARAERGAESTDPPALAPTEIIIPRS